MNNLPLHPRKGGGEVAPAPHLPHPRPRIPLAQAQESKKLLVMLITAPQELGETAQRLEGFCQEGEIQRHHFLGLRRPSCDSLVFPETTSQGNVNLVYRQIFKTRGRMVLRVALFKICNTAKDRSLPLTRSGAIG